MKKIVLPISLMVTLWGCSLIITPNSNVEFIVINKSKNDINWIKVFIEDEKQGNQTNKEILIFKSILSSQNSEIQGFNIKDYSEIGKGSFKIQAVILGHNDTLRTGGGNYKNYYVSQEFTKEHWHTVEIVLTDLPNSQNPTLYSRLALYENGKFVKRNGD